MSLDESYPGIQPTTARKAGDSLTFTIQCQAGRIALLKLESQAKDW
jgi:hypothetical protein